MASRRQWMVAPSFLSLLAVLACSSAVDPSGGFANPEADAGPESDGFSLFDQGGAGDSELTDDSACVTETHTAELAPLDMYIMLDQSGSMGQTPFYDPNTRWYPVVNAIKAFVQDPAAQGMGVGLQYFPLNLCDVAAYATPEVPIAPVPDNAPAIIASLDMHMPFGGTPTTPALQGAIQYAREWKNQHPSHVAIVVLATDGVPDGCGSEIGNVVQAAQQGVGGDPSIRTAVIGVGSGFEGWLDNIAIAGDLTNPSGASSYFPVEAGAAAQQQFLEALNVIRGEAILCEYAIPEATTGIIDPNRVNVRFTPSNTGTHEVLVKVENEGECGAHPGWYYDDPMDPGRVILCEEACNRVMGDDEGRVDLLFGCLAKTPA